MIIALVVAAIVAFLIIYTWASARRFKRERPTPRQLTDDELIERWERKNISE